MRGVANIMEKDTIDILVVDDQVGVRRLLFEALTDEGYNVQMAAGGAEALAILSRATPSLILLDIKMPGMTGFETLQEIRRLYGDLPVAMMTAYGEVEILNQTKELGVTQYVNKPFDLDDVRTLTKAMVAKRQSGHLLSDSIG